MGASVTDDRGRLSSWLVEAGGHHDYLEIRERGAGRGLVATRPVARGTQLLQVPRTLLVTPETALDGLAARAVPIAELARASGATQLAVWLLVERRDPASAFQPYVASLPPDFPEFPINATVADLALLEGSLAGEMVESLRASLVAEYAELVADLAWFRSIGFDEFVWAKLCVGSRTYLLRMGDKDVGALVPFADMANHERGPNSRWAYDPDDQVFRLVAQRDYLPGEEVCCDYGPKPNLSLLARYGFCLDDNDADQALIGATEPIRVRRDPSDPFAQLMLLKARATWGDEAAARVALAEAARAGLARFPTTLAEDRALLATAGLSPIARNFIRARLGEKRVLHAWLDFATDGPAEWFR
jgi:histone-lysine N-methyltransferase SETD3